MRHSRNRSPRLFLLLVGVGWLLGSCQAQPDAAVAAGPPPVGHYQGSVALPAGPHLAAALDVRHPSPGHYEAELTLPEAAGLSFVADTVTFAANQLQLRRPGRPGQTLRLTLDGDFWRGTLALDSVRAAVLLVRRGAPAPSTYRVEELPQASGGTAWLFAPADTRTPGPALALLPDAATAAAAPLWADALARNGIIVLLLPPADTAVAPLPAALRLLRATAGADTATVGAWLAGGRALAFAEAAPTRPKPAFLLLQNIPVTAGTFRAAWAARGQAVQPILALAAGREGSRALRQALPRRRTTTLLTLPAAPANLLVPGPLGPELAPQALAPVLKWLRER